ncbi:TAXI family TRAP transporter solute-binding subunit [Streptomyces yaizuensis]|uniref:TAXI family TRAP transporter solute-binding subunit n=1 Tax=Streptomyces yaizuensis TaxID=2989713 RepID=A0ABQ5PAT5_9ACTN|nr:TAXI family TRAP transporter solute-binding subunit [Streptomyces sp. YSPA8]GLF99693.1 TAXI family TRAP transporter solute-binding subunit [Streptomyces sp. YSPA8]
MFQAVSRLSRRRAAQAAAALLVVSGLLLWWLFPLGEPGPRGDVRISTGLRNGVYDRYGELLRTELAHDLPEVDVVLENSAGSQENLARVAGGGADFAIATADAVVKYRQKGEPGAAGLRGCARLYDDYVQLVVAEDSPVRSVADLRGRKVGIGPEGSGVRLVAERLLQAAGLDPDTDVTRVPAGIDTAPGLMEKKAVDAFFWSGGLPTGAVEDLSRAMEIRLVPLPAALVEEVHRSSEATSHYRQAVIPADAYRNIDSREPVPTMAVANLLVTTDTMDEGMVEGLTRTVIRSRDEIGQMVHPAQGVDLRTAIYTAPLALHEGAQRYYTSVKP